MGKPVSAPAWTINPPTNDAKKTFCVLGVARGGTSMVAGVLAQLGIPMGDNIDKNNIEDQDFLGHGGDRSLFNDPKMRQPRTQYLNGIQEIIARRNRTLAVWGWKDPICILYLRHIAGLLINSHFILVTRDPAAVAMREMLEENVMHKQRVFAFLGQSLEEYRSSVDFLVGMKRPTLLVSYERSLRFPEALAAEMHAFVHPQGDVLSHEKLTKIGSYIVPDRRTGEITEQIDRGRSEQATTHTTISFAAAPLFGEFDSYFSRIDQLASQRAKQDTDPGAEKPAAKMDHAEFQSWLTNAYTAAAAASNSGDHETSAILICRVLRELTARFPVVGLGPVAVARAAEIDFQTIAPVPDLLVGSYNILGMAALLTGDARTACDYFDAGFTVARRKLELSPASILPISMSLLWWLAFHAALAAKHAGRASISRKAIDAIRGYLHDVEAGDEDCFNAAAAREVYERAIRENLIGAEARMQA